MDVEKFINELVRLSFLMKRSGHDLFIRLSPHVEEVSIDLHIGGFAKDSNPTHSDYIYYDKPDQESKAESILDKLRKLYTEAEEAVCTT